jgi:hypothetical protein
MAVRVARGLFRLWLVLSMLWIGGVGATTWWTLPVDLCVTPPGGPHVCNENDVIGVECAPGDGQFHAAVLTVCRA